MAIIIAKISIIFSAAIVWLTLATTPVAAETGVTGGLFTTDQSWSDVVTVEGVVEIDVGATLRVAPGTHVRFADQPETPGRKSGLVIYGSLEAIGTPDRPIRFSGIGTTGASWAGLSFSGNSMQPSTMKHCRVADAENGIEGRDAVLSVKESVISGNRQGVVAGENFQVDITTSLITMNETGLLMRQNQQAVITACRIEGNAKAGVRLEASSVMLRHNRIADNGAHGIVCHRGSSPKIADNVISGQQTGVLMDMMSSPELLHNDIHDNSIGLSLNRMAFPVVEYNRIRKNRTGIYCNFSGYPRTLKNNDIVDNRDYSLDLGSKHSAAVSLQGPFSPRSNEFSDRAGMLQLRRLDSVAGQPLFIPADGIIDVTLNWWGEQVVHEMESKGADANIAAIGDSHDRPTVVFRGVEYARDRFRYAPWLTRPAKNCGTRARAEERREVPSAGER